VKSVQDRSVKLKPVKIDDFFRLEYRTGSITSRLTDDRMQILPAVRWSKLKEALAQEIDEYAPLALTVIGSTLGSAFVEKMIDEIGEPEALAKHLTDVATAAGWGVVSMTGDIRYGSRYVVTVANCAFCEKEELASTPQCSFLEGILKGMARSVYGTPHKVSEERCSAMGEALCQFIVEECWSDSETGTSREKKGLRISELKNVEDLEKGFWG
jgi:predicted hydrocarbon binding protein